MQLLSLSIFFALVLCNWVRADVTQLSPEKPYNSRNKGEAALGHVDRQLTAKDDGSGIHRRDLYSIDPTQQLRSVQYVADGHGSHRQEKRAMNLTEKQHAELFKNIPQVHTDAAHVELEPPTHPQGNQNNLHQRAYHQDIIERTVDLVGTSANETVFNDALNHLYERDRVSDRNAAAHTAQHALKSISES